MTSPAYYEHLTRWQVFQQGWQYIAAQEAGSSRPAGMQVQVLQKPVQDQIAEKSMGQQL